MAHDHDSSMLLQLRDGELLHGPRDRAAWITVLRGRAWITQAHDLDDHFLCAGQSMHLAPGARTLVGADGPVHLLVAKAPSRRERGLGLASLGRMTRLARRTFRTIGAWFRRLAPAP